jgi:anthranilate phosphoribosyltransferase
VLAGRGCSALVFHGDDGLDELTATGPSTVWVVHDSAVTQTRFDPADLGIARCQPADLRGGGPAQNADAARAMLAGQSGPVRDTVLLNAAAALVAQAGTPAPEQLSEAIAVEYAKAAQAVDSGAALALLDRWVSASQRLAA